MFLSDTLNAIYEDDKNWSLNTCNKIIRAIGDKCKEEIHTLCNIAEKRGSMNSKAAYSVINNQKNTFERFCKEHSDIPSILVDKVNENLSAYKKIIDDVVYGAVRRN